MTKQILPRLQKDDEHTKNLIKEMKSFLFSIGIRTSEERAWTILQHAFKLPFAYMIDLNKEIEYQGQGTHISSKHGDQLLVIKNLGRFELKAVGKEGFRKPVIKFIPSEDVKNEVISKVKVIE